MKLNNIFSLAYFIIVNSLVSNAQTKPIEILTFKNFDVNIINFISEHPPYPENDTSQVDTLLISENPCDQDGWYIEGTTLKILPKFKYDSFALSFAYQVDLFEVNSESGESMIHITDYKTIAAQSKNSFRIPELNGADYIKSIKKKYHFQDTIITGASEGGPFEYRFARNGKVFADHWNYLYLRIKRFNSGKLKETKFIFVGLTEGCD